MRRALFGTMTVLAAGMLASGAQAQDPISVSVSGYFTAGLSSTSQDLDQNVRNHAFDREAEIFFRGEAALDGNLIQTVGINVELEAESIDGQIDETYMYFGGPFGQLRLGADDGAMEAMGVYPGGVSAPTGGIVFCTFSAVPGACSVGEGAFGLGPDYDAEKIKWQSPRVGGATVALSYTPEGNQASGGGSPQVDNSTNEAGAHSEVVAVGGNWSGEFAGGNLTVGAGYAKGSLEAPDGDTDQDRTEWIVGVAVSMAGINFSGNYSVDDHGESAVKDRTTLAAGASAPLDLGGMPLTVGVTFVNTERSDSDNSAFSFGISHSLGAGVSIAGEVQFWDMDFADNTQDNQATVGIIGTRVSF